MTYLLHGFGYGFGGLGGSSVVDLTALATGQSLQDRLFTADSGAGDTAFQTEAALYFPGTITHTDAAATNQYLTKSSYDASGDTGGRYYWDDSTSSKGPRYTAEIDPVTDKATYNAIKLDLGQSDGVNASFPHTKAQYKTYLKEFLAQLKSDFPNATIFINILNRTTQSGDFDASYNTVRQAQMETIVEVSYARRGIDCYDLAMVDNFHFTQAGAEEYAEREARRIASHYGRNGAGSLGPSITNLQLKTDRITFDVSHDAGTDWSAPSGTGGIAVEDDGTATGDVTVTRTDATSGLILLPEGEAPLTGSIVEAFVNYGDGGALGATPSVAKDTATNAMPFRSAANISVASGDPVADLANSYDMRFRVHARGSAKTYSSANIVDAITALDGESFSEFVAGEGPEFTTNYLRFARNTDRLLLNSDWTNDSTFTLGLCGQLPSSIPSFSILGGFANAAGTSTNNARLYLDSSGRVVYQAADSVNGILSAALSADDFFIIIVRANSLTSMDGFVNTKTPINIDPAAAFSTITRWAFGNATNQPGFVLDYKMFDTFMTQQAISDTEVSDIYDFWNTQFSLGL